MALRRAAAPLWALMPRAAASFDVVAVASSAAAARLFTTHPSTPIGGRASTRREHTPISVPRSETGQFDTKNLQFLMLVDLATLGFCKVEVHVDNTADLIKAAGWLSNKYEFAGQHLLMRPYVRSENVSTLACSFNAALISDWLCSVCASLNPSTHTQCWKCGQVQQESPQRVSHDSRGGGASSSGGTSGSRHNRSGTDGGRTSVHTRARQISHDIMQQQQRQQRQQGQQQALAPPPAAHAMVCSSTRPSDLATFVVNRLVSAPPGTNVVLSAAGPTSLRNLVACGASG
ncbi:hypothetical protein FOA52_006536 [Chlamydomonas sp. UWO 241]|nr:hypothetical protein FOA52_006536 [Chlamydomonas sp. UWO 241]